MINAFLSKLRLLSKVSMLKTLRLFVRLKGDRIRLLCFRGTHLYLGKNASFSGTGSIHFGKPWPRSRLFPSELIVEESGKIEAQGAFVFITGSSIVIRRDALLSVGSGFVNSGARIDCSTSVSIGEGVYIGCELNLRDGDGHRLSGVEASSAPISIGNDVWIGSRVTILKGVNIGDGSVVASGSVVTKSIPPACLAAGVPARVVRTGVAWRP